MSEYEAPPAAPPRKNFAPLVGIGLILLVGAAVLAFLQHPGSFGFSSAPIKHVGCIDQEALSNLPDFKKAQGEAEKVTADAKKQVEDLMKKNPKGPTPELERQVQALRMKVQQDINKLMNPLKVRAEYAIAQVARSKDVSVVLDKRIIVYGVPDLTEDVKKAFETAKETDKIKDDPNAASAPIGYFDQEVVRTLKVFQQAELQIYQKKSELAKEFTEKTAKMTNPSDKELLERQYKLKAEAYQEQIMTPLVQAVNDSVKEVAQAEGLSLVLDKQHVMQGGRNMTDKVVETFLKKAGAGPGEGTATPDAATPTPADTPAGGK